MRFLLRDSNKLDIGDAHVVINRLPGETDELVLSYKSIYINTFTILCLDTSGESKRSVVFRHESF